jgi:CRISPR/Cas system CSM-associated protein Csm3 (group 7 of RAMP superfamily)
VTNPSPCLALELVEQHLASRPSMPGSSLRGRPRRSPRGR